MWGHMGDYGWGWGGIGMGIGMLLFWGLLIAAIYLLVKLASGYGSGPGHRHEKSAIDVLRDRYARGEIEREEFLEKKRDLES